MSPLRVVSGNLFLLHAFDVGYDIDLAAAQRLCEAVRAPGFSGIRAGPGHLQYSPRPLVVPFGDLPVPAGGSERRIEGSVKIFDFGVLSVTSCLPLADRPWEEFAETALSLAGDPAVAREAEAQARLLFEAIRPAVTRPGFVDLVEDYGIWHVGEFSPPLTGTEALARLPRELARLLTLDPGPFSEAAVSEVLRNPIRYWENDLVLADWNAAFLYDPRFRDTVEVLEFLNVQMLELRFFDRLLHEGIDAMGEELRKRRGLFALLFDPYEKPRRRLSEVKMDVALLRERIHNALKLAGDAYLARVYDEARRRAGTERWEDTVRDQLKTLEDIYTILTHRAEAARAAALETVIILLIALEIVMGLLRW